MLSKTVLGLIPFVRTDATPSLVSVIFFLPLLGGGADSSVNESGEEAPESLPPSPRPPDTLPRLAIPRFGRRPPSTLLDLPLLRGSLGAKSADVGVKGSEFLEVCCVTFGVNCTFKLPPPSSEESKEGLLGTVILLESFVSLSVALKFFSSQIFSTRSPALWDSSLDKLDSVSPKLLLPDGVRGPFRRIFLLFLSL